MELMTASPNEMVEVAVVEVAEKVRKSGVTSSISLNWWSEAEEVMAKDVFWPAWVEKVWVTAFKLFNVVMPEPAAPEPRHVPVEVSKQPAVSLSPFEKEEVAEEERLIEPPVMVSPAELARPAVDAPPAKVEVAVEEEFRAWSLAKPVTVTWLENVEEAVEMRPVVVAKPEEPMVKRSAFAAERIWRKLPVCPVVPLRVRRVEAVEVEVRVSTVEVA
jgi:hypothetical protein